MWKFCGTIGLICAGLAFASLPAECKTLDGIWFEKGTSRLIRFQHKGKRLLLKDIYANGVYPGSDIFAELYLVPGTTHQYVGRLSRRNAKHKVAAWRPFGGVRLALTPKKECKLSFPYRQPKILRRMRWDRTQKPFEIRGLWKEKKRGWLLWIDRLDAVRFVAKEASPQNKFNKRGEPLAQFHRSSKGPNFYVGRHKWGSSKVGRVFWGKLGGFYLEQWSLNQIRIRHLDSRNKTGWVYERYSSLKQEGKQR